MKAQSGFTLLELVVVVVLIGIVLAMATLNFSRLNERNLVVANIREIYSTLMKARNDASKTNTPHLAVFSANQLQTGQDADGDNSIDGTPGTINFPRFTLKCGVPSCAGDTIAFDRRGLASINQTISISGFSAGTTPAMDCIEISATRLNMGKMSGGGTCVQQ